MNYYGISLYINNHVLILQPIKGQEKYSYVDICYHMATYLKRYKAKGDKVRMLWSHGKLPDDLKQKSKSEKRIKYYYYVVEDRETGKQLHFHFKKF